MITVALDEIVAALEDAAGEIEWYLDRQTGEVLPMIDPLITGENDDLAARVEADEERYVFIEPLSSHDGWQVMADFVEVLDDVKVQKELERALNGRKPFRAFKDTLLDYPDERERWFRFKETAYRKHAEAWFAENDIEAELVSAVEQAELRG